MRWDAITHPHPGAIWWKGVEAEGAAKGRRALIANSSFPLEELHDVEHVFLTERFEAWSWLEAHAASFTRYSVTKGCFLPQVVSVRYRVADLEEKTGLHVTLMLRVPVELMKLAVLREDDEVSLGQPFNLITFRCGDGVPSHPEDYADDGGGE